MSNIIKSRYADAKIVTDVSFPAFVLQHFKEYGSKVAMVSPKENRHYTYADLVSLSEQVAIGLHQAGVKEKDVLATCLGNFMELVPFMLGANLLGAIVNTSNPAYTVRELVYQFNDCRPRFILTTSKLVEKVLQVQSQCTFIEHIITLDVLIPGCLYFNDILENGKKPMHVAVPHINPRTDVAFLLNSSGTTGMPKAVMLTHFTLVANLCQTMHRYFDHPPSGLFVPGVEDVILSVLPLFHVGGIISGTFWPLCTGASCVIFERYDPVIFLRAIRDHKVTTVFVPPPILVYWTRSPQVISDDFSTLKYICCGGAVISATLAAETFEKIRPKYIIQFYGLTELSPVGAMMPGTSENVKKFGSCGILVANTMGKVTDVETGVPLGQGERGEICIKGPQIMKGYLNNEAATSETIDSEGWLHTGDVGYYDEDGYLYVVDRIKEMIKVRGFQVAPAELESILLSHEAVAEAAVVGVQDAFAGELPRAYIVLKPNSHALSDTDVKKFVADRVVSYKRLEGGVKFVQALPKTPSGKFMRRALREEASREISKL